jgi:enoyl-CoA hydratase/carnithine racemase
MPPYETLLTERVGEHVLLVTMNRPDVLNAMNMTMTEECSDLITRLYYDPDWVRCVVLTGAGRAFSAGGDRDAKFAHAASVSVRRRKAGW